MSRKVLSGAQAKAPGSAASQNRDAFLSRLFSTNDGAAVSPNGYAVFVMQIKICAKQNRDTDQGRNDRSCDLAEFCFQSFFLAWKRDAETNDARRPKDCLSFSPGFSRVTCRSSPEEKPFRPTSQCPTISIAITVRSSATGDWEENSRMSWISPLTTVAAGR